MAANTSTPRIVELASVIAASVSKIQDVLSTQNLSVSFDEDAPWSLPSELSDAQDIVLDATAELRDLLLDPMSLIHSLGAVGVLPS